MNMKLKIHRVSHQCLPPPTLLCPLSLRYTQMLILVYYVHRYKCANVSYFVSFLSLSLSVSLLCCAPFLHTNTHTLTNTHVHSQTCGHTMNTMYALWSKQVHTLLRQWTLTLIWKRLSPLIQATNLDSVVLPAPLTPISNK